MCDPVTADSVEERKPITLLIWNRVQQPGCVQIRFLAPNSGTGQHFPFSPSHFFNRSPVHLWFSMLSVARSQSDSSRLVNLKSAGKKLNRVTGQLSKLAQTSPELSKQIQALKGLRVCSTCHHAAKDARFLDKRKHQCPGPCQSIHACNHPMCKLNPNFVYKADARHKQEWLLLQQKELQKAVQQAQDEQTRKVVLWSFIPRTHRSCTGSTAGESENPT